jgi:hypothetical protein
MSLSTRLPLDAVELVIGVITRLIIRAFGSSDEAAQNLAMHMLLEYQPETVRELRVAAEAICLGMDSLAAMSESATLGITPAQLTAARRWSCSLSRAGALTQRRLDELQRARRAGLPEQVETPVATKANPAPKTDSNLAAEATKAKETVSARPTEPAKPLAAPADKPAVTSTGATSTAAATTGAATAGATTTGATTTGAVPATTPPATSPRATQGSANPIAEAEQAFLSAYQMLERMRAQWQGAAPDSRAAQQIRAQEQTVMETRLALEQALKPQAAAAPPSPESHRAA